MTDNPNRVDLLDYFLVINFDPKADKRTKIVHHYPEKFQDETIKDTVPQFCWPEDDINVSEKKNSEEFSFILTVLDGSKKFGLCRRYFNSNNDPNFIPMCFCVISTWSSTSLYQQVLDVIDILWAESGINDVMDFVKLLFQKSVPERGETIAVEFQRSQSTKLQTYRFTRSSNPYDYLDYVSFEKLFKYLSVDAVVNTFILLLKESRIIGVGKSISQISDCMNAITSLLYPFTWQHIFIPILPRALLEFVEAPMPYLIGILDSVRPALEDREIEEGTILLNFETGEFEMTNPETSNYLPDDAEASLRKNLDRLMQSNIKGQSFNKIVAHCFLRFWTESFHQYNKFFEDNVFNATKFVRSRSNNQKQFINDLVATQMWEMFIQEREELSTRGELSQCILCVETSATLKKKLEVLKPKTKSKSPFSPNQSKDDKDKDKDKEKEKNPEREVDSPAEKEKEKKSNKITGFLMRDTSFKTTKKDATKKSSSRSSHEEEPISEPVIALKVNGKRADNVKVLEEESDGSKSEAKINKDALFIGVGNDLDGEVLKGFKNSCTVVHPVDMSKEFVVYIPVILQRVPDFTRWKSQDKYFVGISTEPLESFLYYVCQDKTDLSKLSIEQIMDLLVFCDSFLPGLRLACLRYVRESLTVKNCLQYFKYALEVVDKVKSCEVEGILNESKVFFLKNWSTLVQNDELEQLPAPLLAGLIRLQGNVSSYQKLVLSCDNMLNPSEIHKQDTLARSCINLFNTKEQHDFVLTVADKEIFVHKYLLCANGSKHSVPIEHGVESEFRGNFKSFYLFIKYLYIMDFIDTEDSLTIDDALILWQTASYFLMSRKSVFEDKLCIWCRASFTTKNILTILAELEDKPVPDILKSEVLKFVAENINELGKQPQLHSLPRPVLVSILQKVNKS
eukprot:TRINITY_DN11437_c0_g1_i1.p1 TRINITY_DN11437_c0_g1~~TRINITY_DN11437_c0_g1_i1.p1  ORF type:complete len:908 (-),score=115.64 TRINITY_DN11437_c0_g1_i1:17-2740(-)